MLHINLRLYILVNMYKNNRTELNSIRILYNLEFKVRVLEELIFFLIKIFNVYIWISVWLYRQRADLEHSAGQSNSLHPW